MGGGCGEGSGWWFGGFVGWGAMMAYAQVSFPFAELNNLVADIGVACTASVVRPEA